MTHKRPSSIYDITHGKILQYPVITSNIYIIYYFSIIIIFTMKSDLGSALQKNRSQKVCKIMDLLMQKIEQKF